MAKKLTVLALLSFAAFSMVVVCGALIPLSTLATFANTSRDTDYVEVLDTNEAPTISDTYVDSVTYGASYSRYIYTKVKASAGNLCTLDDGGTITKEEEALGLKYVNVTFTGSLNVETMFNEAGEVTTYELTSGTQTLLCGNYVSFVANSETTISSITMVYACSHSYSNSHTMVKTNETVLNGTDLDAVYKCEDCDHTETRMDPTGFNTYRNGEMINVSTTALTISEETQTIGGVSGSYAVTGATDSWNDKIEAAITTHKSVATARANIKDYKIKAISFDVYADSTSTAFRIASPLLSTGAHANNYINFVGYTYSNSINSNMKIYDPTTMQYVGAMNAQKWYTIVVEYPDINSYPANQYHCVEICKIVGSFHYANVRYWHELPRQTEALGFVWPSTGTAHVGTYALSATPVGGRENVYLFTGANTYKDQLDINWSSRTTTASSGQGSWQDIFYFNKYNLITSYSVDVYLPTGSTLRVQGANPAKGAHLTNLLTAEGAYTAFNNGTFNTTVTLATADGTSIAENGTIPSNTWLTITWDISSWQSGKYEGAAYYLNMSLVAPKGSIGVSNLRCVAA